MRYDIEETAVYDKYVRWCGRTGPQGPSYPIHWSLDIFRGETASPQRRQKTVQPRNLLIPSGRTGAFAWCAQYD